MSTKTIPIAAIGTSAGGIEALTALFGRLPGDTGLAYFVVTHTPAAHRTGLPEILSRCARMGATMADRGMEVRPNAIYVVRSDEVPVIRDGKIQSIERVPPADSSARPIDQCMSAVASAVGDLAIGLLLSGGGNDGSLGMKAIKEAGGLTIAQKIESDTPQYANMPESALALGVVDLSLAIEDIPQRLVEYVRRLDSPRESNNIDDYRPIFPLLLRQVGHDFSGYKEKTFMRRVQRRMQVLQMTSLEEYIQRIESDPDEVRALFKDLLIGVTSFFRDAEAFESLAADIIPKLFEHRGEEIVRIWIPGCSSGEEVYSLAILLQEYLEDELQHETARRIQIFASDIDEHALGVARAGRYPEQLLESVSPERRRRFFWRSDDGRYVVIKAIREACIFSSHSVLRDPPFSRIDLISCRNLLIYLGPEFQRRVIPVFHFALRPGGYLFLGTAENVSQHSDLFQPVDKHHRIFQRRDNVRAQMQYPAFGGVRMAAGPDVRRDVRELTANLRRQAETRVMDRYTAPYVIVNAEAEILYYSPRTGKYLEPPVGAPSRQLLPMARAGLRLDLRAALHEAVQTARPSARERVRMESGEGVQLVDLIVEPINETEADRLYLVVFLDAGTAGSGELEDKLKVSDQESYERLETELRDTRERLQATIEEYETAVEELKSSNEELQSINEELQSTNEELETSKEELQSVNEELNTVNSELHTKVEEVDRANSDLRNLFDSTQVGTVFLDERLAIRTFTPAIKRIFNLISTDRGRPLTDFVMNIEHGDLPRDLNSVLANGEPIERTVRQAGTNTHFMMRILPYRGGNDRIAGVVITFVDISKAVESEAHQRTLVQELNHRVRNMLAVVDAISKQTVTSSGSLDEFSKSFSGRIRGMGTAYALVSAENWRNVSLQDALAAQLEVYAEAREDRISLSGPAVACTPNVALALGMVVHELATNAAKYGALSLPFGRVAVSWQADNRMTEASTLTIEWTERGGPVVTSPPAKLGFGTELVRREVEHVLKGTVEVVFRPTGLEATLTIPFKHGRVVQLEPGTPLTARSVT